MPPAKMGLLSYRIQRDGLTNTRFHILFDGLQFSMVLKRIHFPLHYYKKAEFAYTVADSKPMLGSPAAQIWTGSFESPPYDGFALFRFSVLWL